MGRWMSAISIFSKSRESDHPLGVTQSGRLGRKTPEMNELEPLLSKTPELLSLRQVWAKLQPLKVDRKSEILRILSGFGCQTLKDTEDHLSKPRPVLWQTVLRDAGESCYQILRAAIKTYLLCAEIKIKIFFWFRAIFDDFLCSSKQKMKLCWGFDAKISDGPFEKNGKWDPKSRTADFFVFLHRANMFLWLHLNF